MFSTSARDQIEFLQSWKCEAGRKSLDMRIIPNTPKERMWWMWENVWGCAHSHTWRIVQTLQASSLLDFFSGKSTVESSVTRFVFFLFVVPSYDWVLPTLLCKGYKGIPTINPMIQDGKTIVFYCFYTNSFAFTQRKNIEDIDIFIINKMSFRRSTNGELWVIGSGGRF